MTSRPLPHRWLALLLTFAALPGVAPVRAQESPDGQQITDRAFVADTAAVEPGKPFHVGFHFKILDKWHMYWRFAGGAGSPPTIAEWHLPAGWKAEPLQFPIPSVTHDPHGQTFFGYEHEVFFPVKLVPPAKLDAKEVKIGVSINWQVCEETCILGDARLELTLPVGPAKPANEALFQKWLAQLPQTTEPPAKDIKFDFTDKQLTVRIGGLPPDVAVEFFPIPPPAFRGTFPFKDKPAMATESDGARVATFPFDSDAGWTGLLVTKGADGIRRGWYIGDPPEIQVEKPESEASMIAGDGDTWDPFDDIARNAAGVKEGSSGIWFLLLNGFLGGLLLNLMPCVLPVISLKIFGFVRQAGEARDHIFKLGLAFCAGVFAFFLALAILVVSLSSFSKSFGWGAQFSNPVFLTVMIAIMFLFGLSLLGVFEITLGGGTSSKLSELSSKEGFGGAFVHGFFTTLLGTSCTAPLVAPILGTAFNQPGPIVFALLGAVAVGLALPYFLLTWQPAWMRFLPKPGTWMIRFKQVLGFVMVAFALWFLRSYPDTQSIVTVSNFLLALALAGWLYGSFHERRWAPIAALVICIAGWFLFIDGKVQQAPAQASNLVATVRQGIKDGRPVFVDFTAEWCLNCKFFEGTVIETEEVQKALKEKDVLFVKADYTRQPPDITATLRKMGRVGVPVYVLFRRAPHAAESGLKADDYWIADGLTTGALLEQINSL